MARPYSICSCAFALTLLFMPLVMAQHAATTKPLAAKVPAKPAPSVVSYGRPAADRRIDAMLNSPLKSPLQFVETPLGMIATVLAEDYEIPIVFDTKALEAAGVSPESDVSVSIANMSLKSALRLMLGKAPTKGLTYIIDNEVLLITTHDAASNHLERRIYPVDKLLAALRAGKPATPSGQAGDEQVDELTELADALTLTISPLTWRRSGAGQGEVQKIAGKYLVVLQTQAVHEEIEGFLTQLATAAAHEAALSRPTPLAPGQ